jgi:hypothetical protein
MNFYKVIWIYLAALLLFSVGFHADAKAAPGTTGVEKKRTNQQTKR